MARRCYRCQEEYDAIGYKYQSAFDTSKNLIRNLSNPKWGLARMCYQARYALIKLIEYKRVLILLHNLSGTTVEKIKPHLNMFTRGVSDIIAEYAVCCEHRNHTDVNKLSIHIGLVLDLSLEIMKNALKGKNVERKLGEAHDNINNSRPYSRAYPLTSDMLEDFIKLFDQYDRISTNQECTDFQRKFNHINCWMYA
jgi:hypothetical protein